MLTSLLTSGALLDASRPNGQGPVEGDRGHQLASHRTSVPHARQGSSLQTLKWG